MKLSVLIEGIVAQHVNGNHDMEVSGIALDSRKIQQGFVFLAVAGAVEHGLVYLQQAVENGAVAVIYDHKDSAGFDLKALNITVLASRDLASKLGELANRFYQSPSKKMDVIGITGTNGKTSCSQFLSQTLHQCGVIGTLGWGTGEALNSTVNTTPDALLVQEILAEFVNKNVETTVMEVSSHGLQQGRVNNIRFKGAVYTNLSRDHLDYHQTMEAYLAAKLILFKQTGLQYVVVNADDDYAEAVLAVVDKSVKKWCFSCQDRQLESVETISAENVVKNLSGISFDIRWGRQLVAVNTKIVGDFNLENLMAVAAVLLAQGYELQDVAEQLATVKPVAGRMESFGGNGLPFVFVDYAHTPDALEQVLTGLRQYSQAQLGLVFGCGGNRDSGKRKQMGAVAIQLADQVIITNDNPRFESPEQIVNDIIQGCQDAAYEVILDRQQAIESMIKNANANDCIVIVGKGHEDYQDIAGVKHPFKDQDVVKQALTQWTEAV